MSDDDTDIRYEEIDMIINALVCARGPEVPLNTREVDYLCDQYERVRQVYNQWQQVLSGEKLIDVDRNGVIHILPKEEAKC